MFSIDAICVSFAYKPHECNLRVDMRWNFGVEKVLRVVDEIIEKSMENF